MTESVRLGGFDGSQDTAKRLALPWLFVALEEQAPYVRDALNRRAAEVARKGWREVVHRGLNRLAEEIGQPPDSDAVYAEIYNDLLWLGNERAQVNCELFPFYRPLVAWARRFNLEEPCLVRQIASQVCTVGPEFDWRSWPMAERVAQESFEQRGGIPLTLHVSIPLDLFREPADFEELAQRQIREKLVALREMIAPPEESPAHLKKREYFDYVAKRRCGRNEDGTFGWSWSRVAKHFRKSKDTVYRARELEQILDLPDMRGRRR